MLRSLLLVLLLGIIPTPGAAQAYVAVARDKVPRQPYSAWEVTDSLGRTVRFYLSEASPGAVLPLVVYVHGSGHQSHFQRVAGRTVPANGHATLNDVARDRTRILIVEKPGVELFEQGDAPPGMKFRTEHTLDRWAEAVAAATLAARRLPGVDTTRLLIVGHSEGGLVAARVAARLPGVTHLGVLAGGGPSQLFDLRALARAGTFFAEVSTDPSQREAHVLTAWDSIRRDPASATRDFLGHPYRRWASFLGDSTIGEIDRTTSRLFIAQGAEDQAVSRASFDLLAAHLTQVGRAATVRLVAGADHSFMIRTPAAGPTDGWSAVLTELIAWYLDPR